MLAIVSKFFLKLWIDCLVMPEDMDCSHFPGDSSQCALDFLIASGSEGFLILVRSLYKNPITTPPVFRPHHLMDSMKSWAVKKQWNISKIAAREFPRWPRPQTLIGSTRQISHEDPQRWRHWTSSSKTDTIIVKTQLLKAIQTQALTALTKTTICNKNWQFLQALGSFDS